LRSFTALHLQKKKHKIIAGEIFLKTLLQAAPSTRSELARQTLGTATLEAASLLGISQSELAPILGLSPATVSRLASGRYLLNPASKEWQFAALFVRLFRSLDSITGGNDEISRQWLRNHNTALSAAPLTLLSDVSGLVSVVQYLDASRATV
jgi:transcriptional regulator with XRE-family HTH domain